MEEGERHHLKRRVVHMEIILIYVLVGKLHTKIMQEEHDVPMLGQCRERTTRVVVGKRLYWK
jgi:hypothetical protein